MPNWKRALIFGSFGAGAFFLLTGRRPVGAVLAAVGAVSLASEYPDQVQSLWRRAPEILDRGNQLISAIARISERIAESGMRGDWREIVAERG
jgi:hypothetical protein